MGLFSKTCEYALRAVFFVAHRTAKGGKVGMKEIAEGIGSPEYFLAKILQDLSKKGILQSTKGPNGGFFIDEISRKRPLADVVNAIDGNSIFTGCGLGLEYCSEIRPCPLHDKFKEIRHQIYLMLTDTPIEQFNENLNLGIAALKK